MANFLFNSTGPSLSECLEKLTESDVENIFEYRIYTRGLDYYQEGKVDSVHYDQGKGSVRARVTGTQAYTISIMQEDKMVYGSCDCPYGSGCKHVAAVLLHIVNEGFTEIDLIEVSEKQSGPSSDFFKTHLESLSKEELIEVLLEHAPGKYIRQIQNKNTGKQEAEMTFNDVRRKVEGFFEDYELLYNPSGFEGALMGQLERLTGLGQQLGDKIGELIIFIIYQVEVAFDEGYLYVDNYNDGDDYFESPDFDLFVRDYASALSIRRKIEFINELDEALNNMSYSTFSGISEYYPSFFSDSDRTELKDYILGTGHQVSISLTDRLFDFLDPDLSETEREKLLRKLSGYHGDYLIDLCKLLVSQERHTEAYETILENINENPNVSIPRAMEFYLDLSDFLKLDLAGPAKTAVEAYPNAAMLIRIKSLIKGSLSEYEDIVRSQRPDELLSFYDHEGRMEDALKLIDSAGISSDYTLFPFFKKNKQALPEEACRYFVRRIIQNLVQTGDSYYERVAESISQLNQINPSAAKELVENIRIEHKRRRNLISLLSRY